jgi:hypothetical protein
MFDEQHQIYNEHGINFDALSHLEAIGLIKYFPTGEIDRNVLPATFLATYYGTTVPVTTEGGELLIGKVLLTKVGRELAPVCGSKAVDGFFEYVCERWKEEGFITSNEPDAATSRALPPTSQIEPRSD